jgi:spermidine/putrescine transport system permease protein
MTALSNRAQGAPLLWAYVVFYLFFLYLPVCLIPLFSFNDAIQAAFPLKGFTLAWYRALAENEALKGAVVTSLEVGLTASALATLCGVTIAYMDVFGHSRLARIISAVARLPILIPGVILGIALLILVNLAGLGPSKAAIIAGHVLAGLPTAVMVMRSRFLNIPRTIPEAAEDLGARDFLVLWRIMLPLSASAIGSAFMLAFLTSFDEFIIAFFLAGTEPTLPLFIWMALGTIILAVSITIAAAAELLRRRGPNK